MGVLYSGQIVHLQWRSPGPEGHTPLLVETTGPLPGAKTDPQMSSKSEKLLHHADLHVWHAARWCRPLEPCGSAPGGTVHCVCSLCAELIPACPAQQVYGTNQHPVD